MTQMIQAMEMVAKSSYKNSISFDYKKAATVTQRYTVEVYDLKREMFFGFDLDPDAQRIKSFRFDKMSNVDIGPEFTPRNF